MKPLSMNDESGRFLSRCNINMRKKYQIMHSCTDGGTNTLFWTDVTRFGCAGQYSACFNNDTIKFSRIFATPYDGNCVGIYRLSSNFIYKTMQCKMQFPMVCIGKVNVETSLANSNQVEVRKQKQNMTKIMQCKPSSSFYNISWINKIFFINMFSNNVG
jgi:hypothetical protein